MKKAIIGTICAFLAIVQAWAQTTYTQSFTAAGSWICPNGVTTVTVECWGGAFEVEIITGNSEAMRSVVRETLGDYGLVAARSPINPGKLIVRLA